MADLEHELRALGARLAVPDPPDVRAAVRARIDGRPALLRSRTARRAVAVVIALAAMLAITPQGRAVVAELISFAGVDIHQGSDEAPVVPPSPLPGQEAVGLEVARDRAGFPVGVPARLGVPDRVLVADSARVVSLLYGTGPAAVRLDEFDGRLDPVFDKTISFEATSVDVGAGSGWWLPAPHVLRYVDREGVVHSETARLAARTLIWESGGVTYRLEGHLTRAEAVAIAASVR
jgi:hypothetical protein